MKFFDTDTENRGQTKLTQFVEEKGKTEHFTEATLAGYTKEPALQEDNVKGIKELILADTETAAAAATTGIPKEMKRLVVTSPGAGTSVADCTLDIETIATPVPGTGEVLVKVTAAPINPSDYGTWYRSKAEAYPMPIGSEGSGIIVATGGGLTTLFKFPVGTPVGFIIKGSATTLPQGAYSEYVVLTAMTSIFAMPTDVPIEDCASFFVNPYTAIGTFFFFFCPRKYRRNP